MCRNTPPTRLLSYAGARQPPSNTSVSRAPHEIWAAAGIGSHAERRIQRVQNCGPQQQYNCRSPPLTRERLPVDRYQPSGTRMCCPTASLSLPTLLPAA